MPGRNIIREDLAENYYHVYARGVNKQQLFLDDADFNHFIAILQRYLSPSDPGRYNTLSDITQLMAFCLMSNHFHLLLFQVEPGSMSKLMQRVLTTYSIYFNKKYQRSGPILESRYRASRISSEEYLLHITRYIHLNPQQWQTYQYSSLPYYTGTKTVDWVTPHPIRNLFIGAGEYLTFLESYKETRELLKKLARELADQ